MSDYDDEKYINQIKNGQAFGVAQNGDVFSCCI